MAAKEDTCVEIPLEEIPLDEKMPSEEFLRKRAANTPSKLCEVFKYWLIYNVIILAVLGIAFLCACALRDAPSCYALQSFHIVIAVVSGMVFLIVASKIYQERNACCSFVSGICSLFLRLTPQRHCY